MKMKRQTRERPPRKRSTSSNRSKSLGVHGLAGLEISSLRKSLNGQTHYNFDRFLTNSIPEQYSIEIIEDVARRNDLFAEQPTLHSHACDEIKEMDLPKRNFNNLRKSLAGNFKTDIVDYGRIISPSKFVNNAGSDPLNDSIYLKPHEKFARQERKFNLADRNRMLNEVDNCIELLSLLGTDVKRGALKETLRNYVVEDVELGDEQIYRLSQLLGTITTLNDPTDSIEMVLKYRLTIREIRSFLLNFIKIKTLEGFLKKEVQKIHVGQVRRCEEPTTESNINELRDRRLSNRNARMGQIVKVRFKGGVTLLIDPVSKPEIITPK